MKILTFTLSLILFVNSVTSSAIYRKFRELENPVKDESLPSSAKDELVTDLKKDVPYAVEIVEPAVVIKEEILIPIEKEKNQHQDLNSIASNEIIPQDNQSEQNEKVIEQKPENVEIEIKSAQPEKEIDTKEQMSSDIKANPENESTLVAESSMQNEQNQDQKVKEPIKDEKLRQSADASTQRPTIFQAAQQIISNNPIGQLIDTFRRPLSSTTSPNADQPQITVTVPNIFQQFQAGVQNITSQITSVFNPAAVQQQSTGSTNRPPNIIETIQTNFQNAVSQVFRPLNFSTSGTQQGPLQGTIQAVLNPIQAVQNFLSGNRGDVPKPTEQTIIIASASQGQNANVQSSSSSTSEKPVDDKVDYNVKNSQEQTDAGEQEQSDFNSDEDNEDEQIGNDEDHILTSYSNEDNEQEPEPQESENQETFIEPLSSQQIQPSPQSTPLQTEIQKIVAAQPPQNPEFLQTIPLPPDQQNNMMNGGSTPFQD